MRHDNHPRIEAAVDRRNTDLVEVSVLIAPGKPEIKVEDGSDSRAHGDCQPAIGPFGKELCVVRTGFEPAFFTLRG